MRFPSRRSIRRVRITITCITIILGLPATFIAIINGLYNIRANRESIMQNRMETIKNRSLGSRIFEQNAKIMKALGIKGEGLEKKPD